MDIGKIIGTIIATQKVDSFKGMKLCVVQPLDENLNPIGNPIICTDHTAQMALGEIVFYVTSGDATQADPDRDTPSDAAIVGIVDTVDAPVKLAQSAKISIQIPEKVMVKKSSSEQ